MSDISHRKLLHKWDVTFEDMKTYAETEYPESIERRTIDLDALRKKDIECRYMRDAQQTASFNVGKFFSIDDIEAMITELEILKKGGG
jgi:hypothetical protein